MRVFIQSSVANWFNKSKEPKQIRTMSKLTLVFAAVAVLMLGDFCSASENLPGHYLEEVKRPRGLLWIGKRSLFPEDHKRAYIFKRSVDGQQNLEDKRSLWDPDFYKRSVDDQQNLKEVKRPGGHMWVGKRSWFPEDYKRASWYPLFHKRSDDNSWTHDFYKRSVGTPVADQQNLEEVKRPAGFYMLGKRSWFPEEDKRSWFPEDYKRNSWTHDFYKRSAGTPYHIIKRSWPFDGYVKDKRAAINLRFSK